MNYSDTKLDFLETKRVTQFLK